MTHPVFIVGRTYKTRDGHEALIYRTDAPGDYPIHGRVGKEVRSWTAAGGYYPGSGNRGSDLMPPAPERINLKVWANLGVHGEMIVWKTEISARHCAPPVADRTAVPCMLVAIVEGDPS